MANEFWLNDRQWLAIEPLLPRNQRARVGSTTDG